MREIGEGWGFEQENCPDAAAFDLGRSHACPEWMFVSRHSSSSLKQSTSSVGQLLSTAAGSYLFAAAYSSTCCCCSSSDTSYRHPNPSTMYGVHTQCLDLDCNHIFYSLYLVSKYARAGRSQQLVLYFATRLACTSAAGNRLWNVLK